MANGIGLMGEAAQKPAGEVNDGGSVDYDFDERRNFTQQIIDCADNPADFSISDRSRSVRAFSRTVCVYRYEFLFRGQKVASIVRRLL
jgi:hypothetical protein